MNTWDKRYATCEMEEEDWERELPAVGEIILVRIGSGMWCHARLGRKPSDLQWIRHKRENDTHSEPSLGIHETLEPSRVSLSGRVRRPVPVFEAEPSIHLSRRLRQEAAERDAGRHDYSVVKFSMLNDGNEKLMYISRKTHNREWLFQSEWEVMHPKGAKVLPSPFMPDTTAFIHDETSGIVFEDESHAQAQPLSTELTISKKNADCAQAQPPTTEPTVLKKKRKLVTKDDTPKPKPKPECCRDCIINFDVDGKGSWCALKLIRRISERQWRQLKPGLELDEEACADYLVPRGGSANELYAPKVSQSGRKISKPVKEYDESQTSTELSRALRLQKRKDEERRNFWWIAAIHLGNRAGERIIVSVDEDSYESAWCFPGDLEKPKRPKDLGLLGSSEDMNQSADEQCVFNVDSASSREVCTSSDSKEFDESKVCDGGMGTYCSELSGPLCSELRRGTYPQGKKDEVGCESEGTVLGHSSLKRKLLLQSEGLEFSCEHKRAEVLPKTVNNLWQRITLVFRQKLQHIRCPDR